MGRASKDKRDMYYRKAKEEGYRARSAYKLLQLHEEFDILRREDITTGVVDLCAAPGSWSQVLSSHLRTTMAAAAAGEGEEDEEEVVGGGDMSRTPAAPRIVAVDLQEMMPIKGVRLLQGDITSEATAREIIRLLNSSEATETMGGGVSHNEEEEEATAAKRGAVCGGNGDGDHHHAERKADLVVCDGAPDVTGMHELDEYLQHQLLLAALNITTFVLRRGGTFVTKMFRGPNTPFLVAKSEVFFRHVAIAKPKSSRNTSMEAFMVCQDYQPPAGYRPSFDRPLTATTQCFTPAAPPPPSLLQQEEQEQQQLLQERRVETVVIPFLACGDLCGYDADMCYDRDGDAPTLPPVHPPRQAPYISADTLAAAAAADGGGARSVEEAKRRRVE